MEPKHLHLVIRFSDTMFSVGDVVSLHNEVVDKHGAVWFGKLGGKLALSKYIETGVEELDQEKLPQLLTLKYKAIEDAKEILGTIDSIRNLFVGFQKELYGQVAAG